jgi:hypothetical protein
MAESAQQYRNYFSTGFSDSTIAQRKASCACGGGCPSCKAKDSNFPVSHRDDASEKAADAMADKIMRMHAPETVNSPMEENSMHFGRQLQTKKSGSKPSQVTPAAVGDVINSATGRSLDPGTRSFMEPRFNRDFSNVRIHDDRKAAESARSLDALAYTVGNNIVFDSGRYDPHSDSGKRLLAHELTHVTQQSDSIQRYRDPKSKNSINYGAGEESFDVHKDKKTKPWVELVTVTLPSKDKDINGRDYWVGTGVAKYHDNPAKLPNIDLNLSASGSRLKDSQYFTVTRIEGAGYMSSKFSAEEDQKTEDLVSKTGWGARYRKDLGGNMDYAVFFDGARALHSGPVNQSSHGCVHVDWSDNEASMKQLNYHSVAGLTKVVVKYGK